MSLFLFSKVESHPNSQKMMAVAKSLRVERDREKRLAAQKQEQQQSVMKNIFYEKYLLQY